MLNQCIPCAAATIQFMCLPGHHKNVPAAPVTKCTHTSATLNCRRCMYAQPVQSSCKLAAVLPPAHGFLVLLPSVTRTHNCLSVCCCLASCHIHLVVLHQLLSPGPAAVRRGHGGTHSRVGRKRITVRTETGQACTAATGQELSESTATVISICASGLAHDAHLVMLL
jgi:hypothetical protein